jgi:ubiquinone/menaquinone biosynthesis C-methylase UbiE
MSSRHYGLYARIFAYFMAREGRRYEAHVHRRKRRLLGKLTGTLLEIGSGAGANLQYLPPDVHVVAVEPNPFMHPHFAKEAAKTGHTTSVVQAMAEDLPLRSETVDAVVSTLALCSVSDVDHALAEVVRVLKPGGRFLFMEHVAASEGSSLLRVQRFIRPAWRRVGDGCEPDRRLGKNLQRAGFSEVRLTPFRVPLPVVGPHIQGVAVK